jgi:acetolactate synthase-1/2/3 large subunit
MGFGVPAAIGAALAAPEAPVICFSGDGSLLMNIQELVTAVEENVNIKIILMNNNSLGLVHQQQDLFYGQRVFASDFRQQVDFITIAQGFGMTAYDLRHSRDPLTTLAQAIHADGPCLVHAPIDVNEKVYPMVPPGAANKDMIGDESPASLVLSA